MSTLWTTGWDNVSRFRRCGPLLTYKWIIYKSGWSYPEGSILGRIYLVPIEEHLFFILQPIFLILLYTITAHHRLIPFDLKKPKVIKENVSAEVSPNGETKHVRYKTREYLQTLPTRHAASLLWFGVFALGAVLVNEAHGIRPEITPEALKIGMKGFYLGWILIWISPVIGWLTYLGANIEPEGWRAFFVGSAWFCMVDT